MTEDKIAKRYARALIGLAREGRKIDRFAEELARFQDVARVEDLLRVLSNRNFDVEARVRILDEVLSRFSLDETVGNFLRVLIRKGRMELLEKICDVYKRLSHEELARQVMTVVSATELDEGVYRELAVFFQRKMGREMIVTKRIDTNILGGARVCLGDEVYDYTLRRQLEDLKSHV